MASGTRVVACNPLTIANGGVNSGAITHEEYGDAEALTFFAPSGITSLTLQASPIDNPTAGDWYTVITGTTPVTITSAVAVAVSIIPPAAKAIRCVAGGAVAGDKVVAINKMWVAGGG